MNPATRGNLIIFSAPSGGGKTSLVRALTSEMNDVMISISHTTRPRRPAETEGIHYHFVTQDQFKKMANNDEFCEYANVFGHLYGTSRTWLENTLNNGTDVILEIDWQGSISIKRLFPDCVRIFIMPPTPEILRKRLMDRNQDSAKSIEERLADAQETFSHINEYDYIVLNDQFDQALSELKSIVIANRLNKTRQQQALHNILTEFNMT